MSVQETVDRILAALTPERLRTIILELSAQQTPDTRSAVSVPGVVEVVTAGADLGTGPEQWSAQVEIKHAIRDLVGGLSEMRYVEGDS